MNVKQTGIINDTVKDALTAVKYIKTLLNWVYCIITIFVSLQKNIFVCIHEIL